MSPDKLAYMANQIAQAFAHLPRDKAVAATTEHLRLFWDVRMRDQIVAQLRNGDNELDPVGTRRPSNCCEKAPDKGNVK